MLPRIFFGDREEVDPEPKINRQDRFKQLEAEQQEREGLTESRTSQPRPLLPPAATPSHSQDSQDHNSPGKNFHISRAIH